MLKCPAAAPSCCPSSCEHIALLCCTVLHCTALYCTALHCTAFLLGIPEYIMEYLAAIQVGGWVWLVGAGGCCPLAPSRGMRGACTKPTVPNVIC